MRFGSEEERERSLRIAVTAQSPEALVERLLQEWPIDRYQQFGDALRSAVAAGFEPAKVPAERCILELEERRWEGDEELAAALRAALTGTGLALTPVPVDLEELADVHEGDPAHGGGTLNVVTGSVWPSELLYNMGEDEREELVGQEDDLIGVESIGSRPGYLDMEMFIELLDDERLVNRLYRAIEGRGAFRRFRDVLFEHDLLPDWLAFANERKQGRARAWLAAEGYTPDWPPWQFRPVA